MLYRGELWIGKIKISMSHERYLYCYSHASHSLVFPINGSTAMVKENVRQIFLFYESAAATNEVCNGGVSCSRLQLGGAVADKPRPLLQNSLAATVPFVAGLHI